MTACCGVGPRGGLWVSVLTLVQREMVMKTMSRVFTVSALSVLAAASLVCMGRLAWGAVENGVGMDGQGGVPSVRQILADMSRSGPRLNVTNISLPAQTPTKTVRLKKHVLLVSKARLDEVKVDYTLKVPMHHVRPDTAET